MSLKDVTELLVFSDVLGDFIPSICSEDIEAAVAKKVRSCSSDFGIMATKSTLSQL